MDYAKRDQNRISIYHIGHWLFLLAAILSIVFVLSVALVFTRWDEDVTKVVKDWSKEETGIERPVKRLPRAIIIGSRKSGTRALLKFLSANPNIKTASKEVHFFDRIHNYRLGLDWYREQMPLALSSQITIEKSPAYLVTKGVPERIKAMNASVKLILVVRNPVTRLISDFSQLLAHKSHKGFGVNIDYDDYYNSVISDEGSLVADSSKSSGTTKISDRFWSQAEANFEDYVRRSDGRINEHRRAIRAGMYSDHLERWFNTFGRDQLHVVDGERLISEPASELRQLESFLGLEPIITEADFIFNQTKGFFCLAARKTRLSAARRKRDLNQAARPVCLGEDKGRRHVRVKRNLTQELQQFYAPYNEYLFSLVGRNFNWSQV